MYIHISLTRHVLSRPVAWWHLDSGSTTHPRHGQITNMPVDCLWLWFSPNGSFGCKKRKLGRPNTPRSCDQAHDQELPECPQIKGPHFIMLGAPYVLVGSGVALAPQLVLRKTLAGWGVGGGSTPRHTGNPRGTVIGAGRIVVGVWGLASLPSCVGCASIGAV